MGSGRPPGSECQERNPRSTQDGTSCRQESPKPGPLCNVRDISFELEDAARLKQVSTKLMGLSAGEQCVLAWLREFRNQIVEQEKLRKIDRRAIAGAVAWEALKNVRRISVRALGPSKIHAFRHPILGGDDTIAKQVEDRGYMPSVSIGRRLELLKTPVGSIAYDGAIMAALADIAEKHNYYIRCNAPILTMVFQAWDLDQWEDKLSTKRADSPLKLDGTMGTWVKDHMEYLTEAVGEPEYVPLFCPIEGIPVDQSEVYPIQLNFGGNRRKGS